MPFSSWQNCRFLPLLLLLLPWQLCHAGNGCGVGEFKCKGGGVPECVSQSSVCDGFEDCRNGEDEFTALCHNRTCSSSQFRCRLEGHCVPAASRCDGKIDCGKADSSDEANCGVKACPTGSVSCYGARNEPKCLDKKFLCDGLADCADESDEKDCPLKCRSDEFICDRKCLPLTAKCDGRTDCVDGADEKHCNNRPCQFASEFHCKYSEGKCVSQVFTCDDHKDCPHGEDEVCPVKHSLCSSSDYFTCRSGVHCVHRSLLCDGLAHCPDASDELNCWNPRPPKKLPDCPMGFHRCNSSDRCVDLEAVCFGRDSCPHPDKKVDETCHRLRSSRSPCGINNGGCEQICDTRLKRNSLVANCSCRPGFAVSQSDRSRCVDVDECGRFGACSQFCYNTVGSFSCDCSDGFRLHGNQCHADTQAKLVFSTWHDIRSPDGQLLVGLSRPRLLAFDASDSEIFFVSSDDSVRAFQLPSNRTRLVASNVPADAVAYDWSRRLLFFATPSTSGEYLGALNVTSGVSVRIRSLDCPRGLAVNPTTGEIFVSLWCGGRPRIHAFGAGGDSSRIVVAGIGRPAHLTIDIWQRPQRIYWVDRDSNGIYSCALDGTDIRAHLRGVGHPGQVAVFEDRLYWNDLDRATVESADKFDGGDIKQMAAVHSVMAISVMHQLQQPLSSSSPGNCSACLGHVCIATSKSVACLCSSGFRLDSASGVCVNASVSSSRDWSVFDQSPNSADSNARHSLAPGVVTLTVALPLACLTLLLFAVLAFCLRRREAAAVHFVNEANANFGKRAKLLHSVDSRTALTNSNDSA